MDLTRLLKARMASKANFGRTQSPARAFLENLASLLKADLSALKFQLENEDGIDTGFLRQLSVEFGELETTDTNGKATGKSCYVYLMLPGKPGLLLEMPDGEAVTLKHASLAMPILSDFSGSPQRTSVFIPRSQLIEEFTILDEKLLRTSQGRTLNTEQTSEMLLSLALDELEQLGDMTQSS